MEKAKSRTSIYSGAVLAMSISITSMTMGFGIFGPFLPLYAELLGASMGLQIGLLTAGFMLTRTLTSTPFGILSDRIGRKNTIVLGLFAYGIITLTFVIATHWTHLVILRTFQGITAGMIWPASRALIVDERGPGVRGRALALFNSASFGGIVAGPALGGLLQLFARESLGYTTLESFRFPFYFAGALGILSAVIAFLTINELKHSRNRSDKVWNNLFKYISTKFRMTYYSFLLIYFAHGFSFGLLHPVLVLYIEHNLGLSREETAGIAAITFSLAALSNSLSILGGGRLADTMNRKNILIFCIIVAQFATISLAFAKDISLILILIVIRSAMNGLYLPSITSMEGDMVPRNVRGRLTGVSETFRGIGAMTGPLIGFAFYDFVSTGSPFILAGIISLISVIVLYILGKEPTREEAEQ